MVLGTAPPRNYVLAKVLGSALSAGRSCRSMWQQRCEVIVVFKPTDPPENGHKGIRSSPPRKVAGSGAQLESPCTNARSKGNKQEGEGATVGQQNCGTLDKKRLWLLEEEVCKSGDCKDVMSSCREKMRRAKTQLELNLVLLL